jgi:hypothetical protein
MRRMGAPTCPKCKQVATVRDVEWRCSELMPLVLCGECAAAFEELDAELAKLDELLKLSDSISELTPPVEPLPSPTFDTWTTTGSGDHGRGSSRNTEKVPVWRDRSAMGSGGRLQGLRDGLCDVPEPEDAEPRQVPPRTGYGTRFVGSTFALTVLP